MLLEKVMGVILSRYTGRPERSSYSVISILATPLAKAITLATRTTDCF